MIIECKNYLKNFLNSVIAEDYIDDVVDELAEGVSIDLYETAGEHYNDSDVRYALGRVLLDRLYKR